jgi:hypothetical protein
VTDALLLDVMAALVARACAVRPELIRRRRATVARLVLALTASRPAQARRLADDVRKALGGLEP